MSASFPRKNALRSPAELCQRGQIRLGLQKLLSPSERILHHDEAHHLSRSARRAVLPMDLHLFAGQPNTNLTSSGGLTAEMKTYYSDYLIDLVEPELVHDLFAQKHPIPKNGGKTIEFRQWDTLPEMTTPLTEGVTPDGQVPEHRRRGGHRGAVRRTMSPLRHADAHRYRSGPGGGHQGHRLSRRAAPWTPSPERS